MESLVKKLVDMSHSEFHELLQRLVDDDFFHSRQRLIALLNAKPSSENKTELEAAFREFFCGYESIAFWLEEYQENPLDGLEPHTALTKKLKRHLGYIHAHRKTTLEERICRRMGGYLESDPMPEVKIAELSFKEYCELIRTLVTQEIFSVRERLVGLLKQNSSREQLDAAFREFFVAYELLELVLEAYDYDPDEGLELKPDIDAEIDQSIADYESGKIKPIPIEEVVLSSVPSGR